MSDHRVTLDRPRGSSKGITTWIRKQIGPPALDVASKEAAETVLKENPVVGFGYFDKFEVHILPGWSTQSRHDRM